MTEMQRILALQRIDPAWDPPSLHDSVRRPGASLALRQVQNKALWYALHFGGLLGFIGVGRGKTLICLLLAELLRQRSLAAPHEVVLLIPSGMRNELQREWRKYEASFYLPHGINILTYAELSRPAASGRLEALRPKAIICDEADRLKDPKTATVKRFMRYMQAHSIHSGGTCRLYAMSGTLARKSLKDWAHIARFALGSQAPVPLEWGPLETFCAALDVRKGQPEDARACAVVGRLRHHFGGKTLRDGFRRRLASAPGVVISSDQGIGSEAVFTPRKYPVPERIQAAYDALESDWQLPDGSLTECGLELNRKLREISLGFWYEWVWPDNRPDTAWLQARQGWFRALRDWLPHSGTGTDSPALVERICQAGPETTRAWRIPSACYGAWLAWSQQKHKPTPPTRAVWIDYFAVHDAVQWARSQSGPSLLWYEHDHFGYALAQAGGYRFVDAGHESDALLADMIVPETIVISQNAHRRGKNLQDRWHRSLFTSPVAGGGLTEQQCGRTYRSGQEAPQVFFDFNAHTPVFQQAMQSARNDARFIEQTHGTRQILCHATFRAACIAAPVTGNATPERTHTLPLGWGRRADGTLAACPIGWIRHAREISCTLPQNVVGCPR